MPPSAAATSSREVTLIRRLAMDLDITRVWSGVLVPRRRIGFQHARTLAGVLLAANKQRVCCNIFRSEKAAIFLHCSMPTRPRTFVLFLE